MESTKDLNYYKNNCEEDYINTPISVLRYITELEQALQLQQAGVMARFILMGFEFNNLWKVPDLFSHENEHGILMTTDEWDNAETFETIELAEYKREYLQANYSDYTWYIVRKNEA